MATEATAGELPLREEMIQPLGVCRRLMRSVTQRLRNLLVTGCISLYVKYGRCWTCSDRLTYSLSPQMADSGSEQPSFISLPALPNEVLDMIFVHLPLTSLIAARCVCKKWRNLVAAPHFIKLWSEDSSRTPWLFLFTVTTHSCFAGEVHALNITLNQWHRISHDLLKGRDQFSVIAAGTDLYIVGGCSLIQNSRVMRKNNYLATHTEVLVFSPLTCSWREAAPMKSPRSKPALGFFKVPTDWGISTNENGQRRGIHEKFVVIVVGGFGPGNQPLDTGEIYDPISNRWIYIASLPKGFGIVCSGAVCGDVFYVYSESHKLASYNVQADCWVQVQISQSSYCRELHHPKLMCCSGRLFFMSVLRTEHNPYMTNKPMKRLWEVDLTLHTASEVIVHDFYCRCLTDANASFTADRQRIYSFEMFQNSSNVLDFMSCLDANLKWERLVPKPIIHEADVSLHSTKSTAVLHL